MKRMKHFLYRIKSASRVKHVQPRPPTPSQVSDWDSQARRSYHTDHLRALAKAMESLNDLGTAPADDAKRGDFCR